ncbi:MAG TPA: hypothetical protein VIJ92_03130 [Ginsengibacter sp.]
MKKQIILYAAIFFIAAAASAQTNEMLVKNDIQKDRFNESEIKTNIHADKRELRKMEGTEVSNLAKAQFKIDFGNIPVDAWERTNNFDEATFVKNGQVTSAFYDSYAKLVGTTAEKTFADLPHKAQEWINKKYSGYAIADVFFFDDNEFNESDMLIYNMPFNGEDSYFVEVKKNNKAIILQVNKEGDVSYFFRLK